MNHSRLLLATPAAIMLAATFANAGTFSVEYLGSFGPAVTFRMNSAGQIAGDYQLSSLTTAMRYTPGVGIQARSLPAGSGMSGAYGINDAGACIGQIDPGPSQSEAAAIWSADNVLTMLPIPAGDWTYNTGTDINNSDVACGFVTKAVVGDDPVGAWRWDAVNGYTALPSLNGGTFAMARDINNNGVICGTSGATESAPGHAVTWDASNQIQDLGLVGTATETVAQAINDAGVVVGSTNNGTPWKYVPGSGMIALQKLAANQPASAHGVNNTGWVVGYAWQSGEPHTVVWSPDGVIYRIEDYAGPDFYFPADSSYPIAISDSNDLVVYAYDFVHACCDPVAVRFHFGFPAECPADIVNAGASAGVVDIDDLLAVIGAWGPCGKPSNCPADIAPAGGNDIVDIDDLLAVIGAWGGCP